MNGADFYDPALNQVVSCFLQISLVQPYNASNEKNSTNKRHAYSTVQYCKKKKNSIFFLYVKKFSCEYRYDNTIRPSLLHSAVNTKL